MIGNNRGIECPYGCCRFSSDMKHKKPIRSARKRDRQAAKKFTADYK